MNEWEILNKRHQHMAQQFVRECSWEKYVRWQSINRVLEITFYECLVSADYAFQNDSPVESKH